MDSIRETAELFERTHPEYAATRTLDALRAREFARLDASGQIYLDYTGASLYADSLVQRHAELLRHDVLGNPHSTSPASRRATELVERTRRHVLQFFNASPDDYRVIFTANASQALKLVGESYPFDAGGQYLLTFDNHNSVNGIREFARARGAHTKYIPVQPPEMRSDDREVMRALDDRGRDSDAHLFAFPAQSNFSGVQHPLEWIDAAHERGWDVLLDAAAFVPANTLDLGRWRPDFVAISFYKMFGYPTGVGALFARREALAKLHRPWFAGGTITVVSVSADKHYLADGVAAFEDGTPDYANLPAVDFGLSLLEDIGVETIHRRVSSLAGWLLDRLLALRHRNGQQLIALYGPPKMERRGATITMNFRNSRGHVFDHQLVETRAAARGMSIRTGCFCNPGAGELALGLSADMLTPCFRANDHHLTYDEFRRCVNSESTGAVRVSLGLASNFADVYAFATFAAEFLE